MKQRRVKLEEGKQREIILNAGEKYGSLKELSKAHKLSYSTMKKYALENILLPENLFKTLLKKSGVNRTSMDISYLPSNWGMSLGGKKGIAELSKKYTQETLNKWRREGIKKAILTGRHYGYMNQKSIKHPKLNQELAEFIGAHLGDGTLTKYFIKISGDSRYDINYFEYLQRLILNLFDLKSKITKDKRANLIYLTAFSKELSNFLESNFNIKTGHKIKNKIKIPEKIMKDRTLAIACLRGLIDTDGSVSRRGRNGSQFCIQFTSHNKLILSQVNELGNRLGIFTFSSRDGCGTNRWDKIIRYFQIVGSSNLRHIVRFCERKNSNNIYQREVVNYYKKDFYMGLNLPYQLLAV